MKKKEKLKIRSTKKKDKDVDKQEANLNTCYNTEKRKNVRIEYIT